MAHLTHKLPWSTLTAAIKHDPDRRQRQHKDERVEFDKKVAHFTRALASAVDEFASTDKRSIEEKRDYDVFQWPTEYPSEAAVYGVDNLVGFVGSVLNAYVALNLLVEDESRVRPVLFGSNVNILEAPSGFGSGGHPEQFADLLLPLLNSIHMDEYGCYSRYEVKKLTREVVDGVRKYCAELFKVMYTRPEVFTLDRIERSLHTVFDYLYIAVGERERSDRHLPSSLGSVGLGHLAHRLPWASITAAIKDNPAWREQHENYRERYDKTTGRFVDELSKAIQELASTDKRSGAEKEDYDVFQWDTAFGQDQAVYGINNLVGFVGNLVNAYVALNLLLTDEVRVRPVLFGFSVSVLAEPCGFHDGGHPDTFAEMLLPLLDLGDRPGYFRRSPKKLTADVVDGIQRYCAELFRIMYTRPEVFTRERMARDMSWRFDRLYKAIRDMQGK